jgi:hypothetical protein
LSVLNPTHWTELSKIYTKNGPPLQPNDEVIDKFHELVDPSLEILMLGVTPQIATAYKHVTAVEQQQTMIDKVWPGNSDTKQAICDNWLHVNLPSNAYDGILGDGSVNMLYNVDQIQQLLDRVLNWLRPGGTFACRMFTRPDLPVTLAQIQKEIYEPTTNFSSLKRLIPMYLVEQTGPFVPTREIVRVFDELCPDRSQTPWTADNFLTMDQYYKSTSVTWFPTRDEMLALVPESAKNPRVVDAGTYDLAWSCPFLVFDR